MVFVDSLRDYGWILRGKRTKSCHLYSNGGKEELLDFAIKMGIKKEWLQKKPGFYHFDLVPSKREIAIMYGAVEKEIHEKVNEKF